jgi:acetyl-CoA carboxylase biotin carboxyl carrier protein
MSKDKTDADIAFVRALAQILNENDLGEIEVEREFGEDDELKIRLTRNVPVAAAPAPAPVYAAPSQPAPQSAVAATADPVAIPIPMRKFRSGCSGS